MSRRLLIDGLGWGFALWLFGYVLGFILFPLVPVGTIGWIIMPFGIAVALWVAFFRIHPGGVAQFALVGVIWLAIAVLGDYFGIVKALNPPDGYYKLDVYIYYVLTLLIPVAAGMAKGKSEDVK